MTRGAPGDESAATATGLYAQIDLAPGTVLAGRYRVESMLGLGGMGMVYRATDLTLDIPVALKLLRPELAQRAGAFERFREELLLARQVSSPRVVRIHDLALHEQRWLISMDFVDGCSLDKRLEAGGALPVDDALRITRQLAEGLVAAHDKGVVHRDLKPANVLLDAHDNAYLTDFGVARSLATSGLTQSGMLVGTPDYVSPEQARGGPLDARSDLYSLGLILYEMLAGTPAFSGGTLAESLARRMVRPPAPITTHRPDVPAWVVRLLDRLLRPRPSQRLPGAGDVIRAIDSRHVPRDLRHGFGRGWGLAAALALGLGGGAWWWQQQREMPVMQSAAPLQRLLVLPLEAGPGLPAPQRAALDAALLDTLAAMPGLAVVDADRTHQALRQLDPAGAGQPDIADLRAVGAARQVLQARLEQRPAGWQIQARLHAGGARPIDVEGPSAATPVQALQAWLDLPTARDALGIPTGATAQLPAIVPAAADDLGDGERLRRGGSLDDALAAFTRAATTDDQPRTWMRVADTALAIGEIDTAADALDRASRKASELPDPLRQRLAAEHALLDGDATAAAAQWQARLETTPDDTFAQLQLGRAQGAGGDFAAAVETLALLTRRDPNDPRAWFELGKFTLLSGDAQPAVDDHLVRALVLYKRSGNTYGEAETVNALGIGYGRLGQTADAIEQYRKAVDLRTTVGNRRGVATSLRNLGNVLALTGQVDEAARHLDQARALYTALGDREGLAAVDNEIGLLAEERGDYPAALDAFQRAFQGWQRAGDAHGGAQALNNIGFAHYQLGAYNDAQVYWQQAAEAYDALGSQTGAVRTAQNLGLLAMARGDWQQARRRLEASLADAERHQMPEEAAVSRRNLAELELQQGHVAAALAQVERAEMLFRQRQDQRGIADVALLRVQALLAARADAQARETLEAVQPRLETATSEQRAIAGMLEADLLAQEGRTREAAAALRQASQLALASGVRQLQLQIALREARLGARRNADAGLDTATARLGHAGLRLAWLEWQMEKALEREDAAAARSAYREATGLLRSGDYRHAWKVHRLGAEALAGEGDLAGAERALARAGSTHDAAVAAVPDMLRDRFLRETGASPLVAAETSP